MNGIPRRSVVLRMPVAAPAIDKFVAELTTWSPQPGDQRVLSGT
jgi:hypothetical protein